jgi:membrane protein YqaA with SNARE-associated domain
MLKKLYNWTLHWAKTPHALFALFIIAFAESSFFPVPPDLLLIAIVLSFNKSWFKAATVCLIGSVLGGMFGYFIGLKVWQIVSPFFFKYVFSQALFLKVKTLYNQYDFWAVFIAGFTPIPYKVFTIAGGVCQINFNIFIIASILSRGARFFLVAILLRIFGEKVKTFIDKYFNLLSIIFVILLLGGFWVIKHFCH